MAKGHSSSPREDGWTHHTDWDSDKDTRQSYDSKPDTPGGGWYIRGAHKIDQNFEKGDDRRYGK